MQKLIVPVVLLLLLAACKKKDSNKVLLPNSIGRMGELAIIASEDAHKGIIGQALDSVFAIPQPYLFSGEGYFHQYTITPALFKGVAKSYHNILIVKIVGDDMPAAELPAPYNTLEDSLSRTHDTVPVRTYMRKNVWATPQQVTFIFAKSAPALYKYLLNNRTALLDRMLENETKTFTQKFAKEQAENKKDTVTPFLEKNFGFTLTMPDNFRVAKLVEKRGEKFAWLRRETPSIGQSILVYTRPYFAKEQLVAEELVLCRDSVCEEQIPGSVEGSYMTTELEFPFTAKPMTFNNMYTVELRGLWRTENDFMGGPFYSLTMVDTAHHQLLTLEGFVYSPKYDKTQYLRQLETILKSFQWTK